MGTAERIDIEHRQREIARQCDRDGVRLWPWHVPPLAQCVLGWDEETIRRYMAGAVEDGRGEDVDVYRAELQRRGLSV